MGTLDLDGDGWPQQFLLLLFSLPGFLSFGIIPGGVVLHYKLIRGCAPRGFLLRRIPEISPDIDAQSQNSSIVYHQDFSIFRIFEGGNENSDPKGPLDQGSDLSMLFNTKNT